MAAPKQEVVLSPILLKIETKFEMYFGGFGRSPTQRKAQRLRHVTADAIFQHGGSQTGSGMFYLLQSRPTDYITIDLTMNLQLMVSHITINCELMKTQCRHITKEEDQLNSNAVLVE
jgi:hypothetical protein